jgi:UDPglucose 6-dehydrogenase
MKIAVVGTGYVGLVTGTCFADSGNDVTCIDIDVQKVDRLNRGEVPIYEPGLAEIVLRNRDARRLSFTTDLASAVAEAKLILLAVGTPSAEDGSADLSSLWTVVDQLARRMGGPIILTSAA